jgi:hypothetical protein
LAARVGEACGPVGARLRANEHRQPPWHERRLGCLCSVGVDHWSQWRCQRGGSSPSPARGGGPGRGAVRSAVCRARRRSSTPTTYLLSAPHFNTPTPASRRKPGSVPTFTGPVSVRETPNDHTTRHSHAISAPVATLYSARGLETARTKGAACDRPMLCLQYTSELDSGQPLRTLRFGHVAATMQSTMNCDD